MMTPDLAMIAEVMLAAEGFREARILAKKTVTLYSLMIQQLSKQVRLPGSSCRVRVNARRLVLTHQAASCIMPVPTPTNFGLLLTLELDVEYGS